MCQIGFGLNPGHALALRRCLSAPKSISLSFFREAALFNNPDDILPQPAPFSGLICIWAHPMGTNGRSVSTSLIGCAIYLAYSETFSLHSWDRVWITSLLLTWICTSNTRRSRIVISRCPLLSALVFWMSAVICFGALENVWCHTRGNLLHLRKAMSGFAKELEDPPSPSCSGLVWFLHFPCWTAGAVDDLQMFLKHTDPENVNNKSKMSSLALSWAATGARSCGVTSRSARRHSGRVFFF